MTDAEKKPCCCTAEPAEKDTVPSCCRHKTVPLRSTAPLPTG